MAKIVIGCKLPNGLTLVLRNKEKETEDRVTLLGLNSSKIIGANYITTEVDADFWAQWKASVGANYAPLKSNAIFEARNETEALAKAKEFRKEKTGFEPMQPESLGVKPADKK